MEKPIHYQHLFWASITTLTLLCGMPAVFPSPVLAAETQPPVTVPSPNHADQDPVTFVDPNLEVLVAKAFNTGGRPITYGDIRHYRGVQPDISDSQDLLVATSLEGLESLRELPTGIGVNILFKVAKRVSWAPLAGVPVSGSLTVFQDGMHNTNFTILNQLHILEDPTHYPYRQLCITGIHAYSNTTGLTDADVHLLNPLLSKFGNLKQRDTNGVMRFTISNQRLTDFSYFRRFGKVEVLGVGQYIDFKHKFIYIDPATFTKDTVIHLPARIKGLDGEPVQTSTYVYYNASNTLSLDESGTAMVSGISRGTKYIVLVHEQNNINFSFMDPITYGDGSLLTTDGMQYYRLKWAKAPVPVKPAPKPAPKQTVNPTSTTHTTTTNHPQPPRKEVATKQHPQHFQPRVVYAIKSLCLYRHATFRVKERQARYAQQPRANRPLFIIIGETKSHAGRRRYRVRDINHESRTDGQTGYITASTGYVTAAYYRTAPRQITVIDPAGVDAHSQPHLTTANPVTHYAQGSVLKVVAIQHRHLTTRFQLTNGTYITANRQLIRAGKLVSPTHIQTQTRVTRYGTANLTGRRQTYRPGRRLKVLGWTYAHPHDLSQPSPRRYRVPGGYVTANPRAVRVID